MDYKAVDPVQGSSVEVRREAALPPEYDVGVAAIRRSAVLAGGSTDDDVVEAVVVDVAGDRDRDPQGIEGCVTADGEAAGCGRFEVGGIEVGQGDAAQDHLHVGGAVAVDVDLEQIGGVVETGFGVAGAGEGVGRGAEEGEVALQKAVEDDLFPVVGGVEVGDYIAETDLGVQNIGEDEQVAAGVTGQQVGPIAAVELVGPVTAEEPVVTATADQGVITALAFEALVGIGPDDSVVPGQRALDVFDAAQRVGEAEAVRCGTGIEIDEHRVDAAAVEADQIEAAATVEDVVAAPPDESVVADATEEGIRLIGTAEFVDAGKRIDPAEAVGRRPRGTEADVGQGHRDAGRGVPVIHALETETAGDGVVAAVTADGDPAVRIVGADEGVVGVGQFQKQVGVATGEGGVEVRNGVDAYATLGDLSVGQGEVHRERAAEVVVIEESGARPQFDGVVAAATEHPVAAGAGTAGEDQVVPAAASQFVVTGAAGQDVVTPVTFENAAAVIGDQHVVANPRTGDPLHVEKGVGPAEAVQCRPRGDAQAAQGLGRIGQIDHHADLGVAVIGPIIPGTAVNDIVATGAAERVVPVAADQHVGEVGAGYLEDAAGDGVDADPGIGSQRLRGAGPGIVEDDGHAGHCVQVTDAGGTDPGDGIVTTAALDFDEATVLAGPPHAVDGEGVAGTGADDLVDGAEGVVAHGNVAGHRARERQVHQDGADPRVVGRDVVVDRDVAAGAAGEVIVAGPADHNVEAGTAVDGVGSVAAEEDVVAVAAGKLIVSVQARNTVVAAKAVDGVVAAGPDQEVVAFRGRILGRSRREETVGVERGESDAGKGDLHVGHAIAVGVHLKDAGGLVETGRNPQVSGKWVGDGADEGDRAVGHAVEQDNVAGGIEVDDGVAGANRGVGRPGVAEGVPVAGFPGEAARQDVRPATAGEGVRAATAVEDVDAVVTDDEVVEAGAADVLDVVQRIEPERRAGIEGQVAAPADTGVAEEGRGTGRRIDGVNVAATAAFRRVDRAVFGMHGEAAERGTGRNVEIRTRRNLAGGRIEGADLPIERRGIAAQLIERPVLGKADGACPRNIGEADIRHDAGIDVDGIEVAVMVGTVEDVGVRVHGQIGNGLARPVEGGIHSGKDGAGFRVQGVQVAVSG